MTLASLLPRRALAALALTLAAAAPRAAAADPPAASPPQDLPALPGAAPVTPGNPAPAAPGPRAAPAPGTPAPLTPGPPVPVPWTPLPVQPAAPTPARPAAPAPYYPYNYPPPYNYPGWGQSPNELPPGYQAPGYANPYAYPRRDDAYALPPPPERRRYSPGLFAGGVVAVGAGIAFVLVGSYLVASAADRIPIYCDTPTTPCAYKDDGPRLAGGAIMMAGGTLLGIAGIPMWFVGSRYVTIPKGEQEKKAARVPELHLGLGSASVSFRF